MNLALDILIVVVSFTVTGLVDRYRPRRASAGRHAAHDGADQVDYVDLTGTLAMRQAVADERARFDADRDARGGDVTERIPPVPATAPDGIPTQRLDTIPLTARPYTADRYVLSETEFIRHRTDDQVDRIRALRTPDYAKTELVKFALAQGIRDLAWAAEHPTPRMRVLGPTTAEIRMRRPSKVSF